MPGPAAIAVYHSGKGRARAHDGRSVAVILMVLGLLCGCVSDPSEDVRLTIEGQVTSAEDGQPIPGIEVELWPGGRFGEDSAPRAVAETAVDGWYRLTTARVKCTLPGLQVASHPSDGYHTASTYSNNEDRFSGRVRCTEDVQRIDVTLRTTEPNVRVTGQVMFLIDQTSSIQVELRTPLSPFGLDQDFFTYGGLSRGIVSYSLSAVVADSLCPRLSIYATRGDWSYRVVDAVTVQLGSCGSHVVDFDLR